jgi:ribosomal protein S18 acetylase RimI-like enzyme
VTISRDQYLAVARLHKDCINQGYLSKLGLPFLTLLYESIDADSSSVLILSLDQNEVIGFVSGTRSMRGIYSQLLRRWPRLLSALAPLLLKPYELFRVIETVLFSAKRDETQLCDGELLSIAVNPKSRGRGVAQCLYDELIQRFKFLNVKSFKIVVGENLSPAHKFYTQMGAMPWYTTQVHKGARSIVYAHRIA